MSEYLSLLARPGAKSMTLACALGWLSFASLSLAVVLAVHDATGSFGVAGAAVGAFAGAAGALAPLRGRIVDRRGAPALAAFAVAYALALLTLLLGLAQGWPSAMLIIAAAGAGAVAPPLIAAARALWPRIAGPELTRTAHATNALIGDVSAVLGPAATGAIAVLLSPAGAVASLGAGPLIGSVIVGRLGVARHPSERKPTSGQHTLGRSKGLQTLVVAGVPFGAALGGLSVGAPAIAAADGHPDLAAVPLACFAAGSVACSLWIGQTRRAASADRRYAAGFVVFAIPLALSVGVGSFAVLSTTLVAAGVGFALVNVALFELLDDVVPEQRAVEALTWITSAEGLGLAVGASAAGVLAEAAPSRAFAFAAVLASVGGLVAVLWRKRLIQDDQASVGAPSDPPDASREVAGTSASVEPERIARVWVVGAGVRSNRQLTLEALTRLRLAGKVFFFPQADLTAEWLRTAVGVDATDLSEHYEDGGVDVENYRRIVGLVGDAAREHGAAVLLMPGHPRVGVSMTDLLEAEQDLTVRTVEGVSSFDTMLCDLGRDPLRHSSLVLDANRLLYYRYDLDSRFDLYIYHVCSVGTRRTHHTDASRDNHLDLLQDYLLRYYRGTHPAFLVESRQGGRARTVSCRLEELVAAVDHINFGTTLFIPGEDQGGGHDEGFAALLRD